MVERVIDVDDVRGSNPLPPTDTVLFFRYNNRVRNKVKNKNSKKFFAMGLVFFSSAIILLFVFVEGGNFVPHQNQIDTKISQYSDNHINANAIATNPEFKNIAFDINNTKTNSSFFSNQIATVVRAIKTFTTSEKTEDTKEYGSWIWTPIMNMTPQYIESILSQAKKDGVNTMYVSIDSYLDIFVMPKGKERERQKKVFGNILEDFIIRANKKGMTVDAEAGWRNWAEDDNVYKAFAVVNYIKNFNAERKNKFRGFQYDVEPYLLDSYNESDESKANILKNFVKLVDQTEYFLGDDTLRFSVVIPDFYDKKDEMTPKFSYNGKKDYVFKHLLNILERRRDSSIIIMSYRNFAGGDDGSIEISKNEIETAKSGGYRTKIIIAQETGQVPPPYITFHNTPKKYFEKQVKDINSAFKPYSNFGGIAIHFVNAFLALK